ncbi:MAG: hypothetical protein ACW981_12055 [Candidatus Hodarchaeales archaeon]|jgi:hypothetical protein
MIENNELVAFTLGIIVIFLLFLSRKEIRHIPNVNLILISFLFRLFSLFLTNIEGFYYPDISNMLEHTFTVLSALFFISWCWITFKGEKVVYAGNNSNL